MLCCRCREPLLPLGDVLHQEREHQRLDHPDPTFGRLLAVVRLLEEFVQGEDVPHRIPPGASSRLEEGKVQLHVLVDGADGELLGWGGEDGEPDEAGERERWPGGVQHFSIFSVVRPFRVVPRECVRCVVGTLCWCSQATPAPSSNVGDVCFERGEGGGEGGEPVHCWEHVTHGHCDEGGVTGKLSARNVRGGEKMVGGWMAVGVCR